MKGRRTILILYLQLVSGVLASTEIETAYPLCSSQSTFILRNEPNETNANVDFAFRLSTGFDDYTSLCRGQWRNGPTDWQKCDEQSENSTAMFRGTASGYLDITHRYLCRREPNGDDIALAIANGTLILDFSQGDIVPNAYIQLSHRKANTACMEASQHPEWVVDSFIYAVGIINTPGGPGPGGPAGVIASAEFNFLNKANDFLLQCATIYVAGTLDINNDTIIDPNKDWPCPFPFGSDLIPPEEYPTTSFRFDKAKRKLTLQQQWKCDDYGETVSFSAKGGTVLDSECTIVPTSSCDESIFVIEGELQ
ncbi:hypothetical protein F4677DRAFT_463376 [Hypoxylon crocopeplum]|nr:hypothetical protein F4677DRAFT_463376 [Hypoxylon crocopeplum]